MDEDTGLNPAAQQTLSPEFDSLRFRMTEQEEFNYVRWPVVQWVLHVDSLTAVLFGEFAKQ